MNDILLVMKHSALVERLRAELGGCGFTTVRIDDTFSSELNNQPKVIAIASGLPIEAISSICDQFMDSNTQTVVLADKACEIDALLKLNANHIAVFDGKTLEETVDTFKKLIRIEGALSDSSRYRK